MVYLSTGQAAKRLSVTPDTILKWIKRGKLPAVRTVGGHYRVARECIESILRFEGERQAPARAIPFDRFVHCWEFFSNSGRVSEGCQRCLVYRARAAKCYEMSSLTRKRGFEGLFCETSCEECPYYETRQSRPLNILIITDKEELKTLAEHPEGSRLRIRYTSCEYECSLLVDTFRPDFVVVDCVIAQEKVRQLCQHLASDPRVPGLKIILAVPPQSRETAIESFPGVCSRIKRPFSLEELEEHFERLNAAGQTV